MGKFKQSVLDVIKLRKIFGNKAFSPRTKRNSMLVITSMKIPPVGPMNPSKNKKPLQRTLSQKAHANRSVGELKKAMKPFLKSKT
jgi:hypothetical protein